MTALHLAAEKGREAVVRALCELGCPVDAKDRVPGRGEAAGGREPTEGSGGGRVRGVVYHSGRPQQRPDAPHNRCAPPLKTLMWPLEP